MESAKKKVPTNLFAGVFGILCLMITGVFGYSITQEMPNMVSLASIVCSVLTMWMVFVGLYVGLVMLGEKK